MTSSADEVATLTGWAVRLDRAGRDRLLLALANLLNAEPLGPRSRALFEALLPALAEGAGADVRSELLLRLFDAPWAPDALLQALVDGADEAALPALARLPALSECAADALLSRASPEIRLAVAANARAPLSTAALDALVDASRRAAGLRGPLARRTDLSAAQAERLASWSSPPLRRALAARFGLQLGPPAQPDMEPETARKLVEKLGRKGQLTRGFALSALRRGRLGVFEEAMAALGGVPAEALRKASQGEDPASLALACAAAGLDRSVFPEILRKVRAVNNGRPSDSPMAAPAVLAALDRPPAEAAEALRFGHERRSARWTGR